MHRLTSPRAQNRVYRSLQEKFRSYHEARKHSVNGTEDVSILAGVDFEVYLSKLPTMSVTAWFRK
jgi:hypothetical protein